MKILIVSKCQTHKPTAGNRRFILNQIDLLRQLGHEVHFLFIKEYALSKKYRVSESELELMSDYFKQYYHQYNVSLLTKLLFGLKRRYNILINKGYMKCDDEYPLNLTGFVNTLNKKYHFDACFINYFYLSKLFGGIDIPLKAIFTHDHFCYKDILVNKKNVLHCVDANQEAIAMQRSPHIFALNTEEAIYFKTLSPESEVYNVFNTCNFVENRLVGNKTLLFLSGSNEFNVNGLNWFLSEIFPCIKQQFPDVTLKIGGSICNVLSYLKDDDSIELCGLIDDAAAFYESADVVINPTYQGTGLKIKTFESIAYDKVTMVHPHSMTGIFNPEEAPVFSSDKASEWVYFLGYIWSSKDAIYDIKRKDKLYVESMNSYIISEYNRFLQKIK